MPPYQPFRVAAEPAASGVGSVALPTICNGFLTQDTSAAYQYFCGAALTVDADGPLEQQLLTEWRRRQDSHDPLGGLTVAVWVVHSCE